MPDAWERLRPKLDEMADIAEACALMSWDQAVMMPPKGAPARARAVATLQGLLHTKLTDPAIGDLIVELSSDGALDEERAASVRVLGRDYDRATKVPVELVRQLAEVEGIAYQAWTEARPADDFAILEPHLKKLIGLKKEEADALGWEQERYDALIDNFEPGMRTGEVEKMFAELGAELLPLADEVLEASGDRPEFLAASFDVDKQTAFCGWLVEQLGFDTQGGRLDTSPHPFTTGLAPGDVRQTTKAEPRNLLLSIYAAIHETGHALYEQGLPPHLIGLPAGRVPSLGLHESQSRLWENHVGRSRPFTDYLLPLLKEQFPDELGMITPEEWFRAVNHPQRTLIRVTADELTYNLHVALRFELELRLFRDELDVADLPQAWNEAMEGHLGIRPESDADGVLQDMHWSMGAFGYFPTYTIGTLYAAAFYERVRADLPGIDDDIRQGDGSRLLSWLREKVHSRAYLLTAPELGRDILGEDLGARPFLDHVRSKYRDLF